jgi:DNA-directed RNA polymerase specialized sigma24 family protein
VSKPESESRSKTSAQFPPSQWTLILRAAGDPNDNVARGALAELCQAYWYPLYAFARQQGCSPHDAEDRTQAFFAHMLESNVLAAADPNKGRFRDFLRTSMKHFLINQWRHDHAKMRGGTCNVVPLDAETRFLKEAADKTTPERLFERNWALALMERTQARLRQEQEAAGKAAEFEHLKPFLMGDAAEADYSAIAGRMQVTEDALRTAVHRLRKRFRKLLRTEIGRTVNSPAETDEEMRYLLSVLSGE